MTAYRVETLSPEDVECIADLHAASFDEAWTPPMIKRIMAMAGSFGLIARRVVDGGVAGFALVRKAADECELLSLAVGDDDRGNGVGAMLLDAALSSAIAVDARKFFLEVAETNDVAIRLYTSRGLKTVGRRPDYYELKSGRREAALTMRRDLPAPATADAFSRS